MLGRKVNPGVGTKLIKKVIFGEELRTVDVLSLIFFFFNFQKKKKLLTSLCCKNLIVS